MSLKLTDDLGRTLVFIHPPTRVVSLVPSDTHSLIALGLAHTIVGRTSYCTMPEVAGAAVVGGTKDVDVAAVLALAPHLVIANQEENTRTALEALAQRVPILVSLPRRVSEGLAHLARLARIFGVGSDDPARDVIRRAYRLRDRVLEREEVMTPLEGVTVVDGRRSKRETSPGKHRAFIPIWMDPLMTLNADTFGSDVLVQCGIANVFGQRLRLYPLAADLGKLAAQDPGGRDVRYPRVSMIEVVERKPSLVILPDEPFAFSDRHQHEFAAALPGARIVRVSGKDLFWYGAWTIDALDRLGAEFAS